MIFPRQFDGNAAEDLGQDVAAKIAKDEDHDCPSAIPEPVIHTKETEVEKKNSDFVTEQSDKIDV